MCSYSVSTPEGNIISYQKSEKVSIDISALRAVFPGNQELTDIVKRAVPGLKEIRVGFSILTDNRMGTVSIEVPRDSDSSPIGDVAISLIYTALKNYKTQQDNLNAHLCPCH